MPTPSVVANLCSRGVGMKQRRREGILAFWMERLIFSRRRGRSRIFSVKGLSLASNVENNLSLAV